MTMIEGGEFMFGGFVEGEVHGEAFKDLTRVFTEWARPRPLWPEGTTFTAPMKPREWSSMTSWAIVPSGVRYELMVEHLREGEPDPREVPPLCWSIMVDRYGAIYAYPRVAQMKVTIDRPGDDEALRAAYRGAPLGLEERYFVGHLRGPLREETHVVSDGYRYATPSKSKP